MGIMDKARLKLALILCPESHNDFDTCGHCFHYQCDGNCKNPRIEQILSFLETIFREDERERMMEEYRCEECSTPDFDHLILPKKEGNHEPD